MREHIIRAWCDWCWEKEDEKQTPAVTQYSVGLAEGDKAHPPMKLLELCEDHALQVKFLQDLAGAVSLVPGKSGAAVIPQRSVAALAAVAARTHPLSKGGPGRPSTCPVCDTTIVRSALLHHVYAVHIPGGRPELPNRCPECGKRYDGNKQGLMTHRRLAHGVDAITEALSLVPGYRPAAKLLELESAE